MCLGTITLGQIMKKTVLFLFVVTISACSFQVKQSETSDQKMARFKSHPGAINEVPDIAIIDFKAKDVGRRPASVESNSENISIKRLYFTTLFEQYLELIKFSSNPAPQLKHCPSFHSSFLSMRPVLHVNLPSSPESFSKLITPLPSEMAALYPELSLPATIDNIYPKVGDLIIKKTRVDEKISLIKQGIDIHIQKNFQELSELCQTGSSSNYYSFENLVTFMHNSTTLKADKDGVKMLFKTTLFSNAFLLKSLNNFHTQDRSPSSIPLKGNSFITQTKTDWIESYFETVKSKRSTNH
jgi:hypothetical protein